MELESIPIKDLWTQYGVGKTLFYEVLDKLKITPTKQGNRSYLSADQKTILDRYFQLPPHEQISLVRGLTGDEVSISVPAPTSSFIQLVHEIAAALRSDANPIEHWFSLERAAMSNLLLSSMEIKQLIGVKPAGDRFTRGSFTFIKSGKIGSQSAWKVELRIANSICLNSGFVRKWHAL